MKYRKKIVSICMFMLAFSACLTAFRPVTAQAAVTKNVRNIAFSPRMTSKIRKKSTTVRSGATKLKLKKEGYVRFKVPKTKTYTFTFSGMTAEQYFYNNGYSYISVPVKSGSGTSLKRMIFRTAGGKSNVSWYCSIYRDVAKKLSETPLEKRTCKLKLKKGMTVYIYFCFLTKGTVTLKIK